MGQPSNSAPIFAATVISVIGILFCVMVGVVYSDDPAVPLSVVGVVALMVFWTVVRLSSTDSSSGKTSLEILSSLSNKKEEETTHTYKAGKYVKVKKEKNEPPTVETIRQIKIDAGILDEESIDPENRDIDFPTS